MIAMVALMCSAVRAESFMEKWKRYGGNLEGDAIQSDTQTKAGISGQNRGWAAYQLGDFTTALKEWKPLAEQGDAIAQNNLGKMYQKGRGVLRDYKEAFKWFLLAAEQGHVRAQKNLAKMYEKGRGVPQNEKEAFRWYRLAAEQGDSDAQQALAILEAQKAQTDGFPSPTLTPPQKIVSPPKLPSAQAKDITPPIIDIAAAIIVETDSATVHGRVSDDTRVAQVTVNGVAADLGSGSFSFKRYVPSSGTTVLIEAIDEWGNKSSQTVKLILSKTKTVDQQSFASLDPTTISGQPNRDAVALIIGVADYTRAPKAEYADSDANVFSDYARRALGIPRDRIKLLTNGSATLIDTKITLKRWLRGRIEEGKTDVYVFYAGHGLASPDGKNLYLLPYDGAPSLLDETSLQRSDIFDVIAKANPKSATVFLDTCYSGLSRGEETLLASARPVFISPKQQSLPKGFTVFSAASGQQISSGLDEAKHGLFSYYLMRGMEGPADANADRKITVGELHAYVRKNVKQQAIRLGREQIPELQGDAERVLMMW